MMALHERAAKFVHNLLFNQTVETLIFSHFLTFSACFRKMLPFQNILLLLILVVPLVPPFISYVFAEITLISDELRTYGADLSILLCFQSLTKVLPKSCYSDQAVPATNLQTISS